MIKENNITGPNIAQIAILMAILTLISKCFGFIREAVMAGFFGAGYITDSYVMAQSIPTILLGGLFIAVSTAYMPLFSEIVETKGSREGELFTSRVINVLIILSFCASLVGIIFAKNIVEFIAGGFDIQRIELTCSYIRITFLYILFSSVAGIFDSYLQYKNHFFAPIIAGYSLNVMAIAVIIFSYYTNYRYLAYGMLLGQIGRCIILIFASKRESFHYSFSVKYTGIVKKIVVLSVPVFISSSIQQINTFVDKTLASRLDVGSVSALYYAMLLITLITGLTASIFSTIIFPKVSQANSQGDYNKLSQITSTGINLIFIITIPFTMGILLYGKQVVQIIYERGAFDMSATVMTGSVFIFYGLGLPSLAINDLLMRVYYAMHDMKTPMCFAGICVCVNVVLNNILVLYMKQNGLALATSIAFIVNTILLFVGMHKKYNNVKLIKDKKNIVKIIVAALIAVGGSYIIYKVIMIVLIKYIYIKTLQLGIAVLVAVVLYYMLLTFFKVEEIKFLKLLFNRKEKCMG